MGLELAERRIGAASATVPSSTVIVVAVMNPCAGSRVSVSSPVPVSSPSSS